MHRSVPVVIFSIAFLVIATFTAVCENRGTSPGPQQITVLATTPEVAPVPAKYQAMYANLKAAMDKYDSSLTSRHTSAQFPVIFGTELLQANANRGEALLQPQVIESVKLVLDRFQALGIQGVTIAVHYPVYTPGYPHYTEYVAFYKEVAAEVHSRGMKLCVENHILFANTVYSPVTWNYAGVSFDQYEVQKKEMVSAIIRDLKPEYLDISAEPDTEYALTGWKEMAGPEKHAELVNYVLGGLDRGSTKIGAGVGSWGNVTYAEDYVATGLDFISVHVYPTYGDDLTNIDRIAGIAHAGNKSVIMDEAWLYKTDSSLTPVQGATSAAAFGLDIFSFYEPLDEQFIRTITLAAREDGIEYISPFWSTNFFGYVDYSPQADSLAYSDRVASLNSIAAAAMRNGTLSPTGEYYQTLIRQNT